MTRPPPRSTRTDTLFPYTTLFRSDLVQAPWRAGRLQRLGDLERLPGRVAADQRLDQRAGGRAQVLQALVELRGEVVGLQRLARSDERTVGNECVGTCRSRWEPKREKTNI